MATAAWSRLRAPPLHSGATDTLFGLPVHGCHVPDLWLTGSAPYDPSRTSELNTNIAADKTLTETNEP